MKDFFYYLFYLITGPRIVSRIYKKNNDLTTLIVKSEDDFTYTLYCEKINYFIKYKRFFIPDRVICVYRVYSVIDGEHKHKEFFDEELFLPKITGLFLDENRRRELILEAYIDIITDKFIKK